MCAHGGGENNLDYRAKTGEVLGAGLVLGARLVFGGNFSTWGQLGPACGAQRAHRV